MKPLYEILDKKNFRRLVAECGGKRVWVPKLGNNGSHDKEYFEGRNKAIRSFRNQGVSLHKLSKMYNLSIKSIYNITKGQTETLKKNALYNGGGKAGKNGPGSGAKNNASGYLSKIHYFNLV